MAQDHSVLLCWVNKFVFAFSITDHFELALVHNISLGQFLTLRKYCLVAKEMFLGGVLQELFGMPKSHIVKERYVLNELDLLELVVAIEALDYLGEYIAIEYGHESVLSSSGDFLVKIALWILRFESKMTKAVASE